jgi:hypothetical protein
MLHESKLNRRSFLFSLAASMPMMNTALATDKLPPVRAITRGPKFHWFGYYDKLQFDPTGRYVLGMEVDFEHRSPRPEDVIKIGMVDLKEGDRWIELGDTRAWNWQQGSMLQWIPGSKSEIIWNDRAGDRFVSHILDVKTRKRRTLPAPIYTLSPELILTAEPRIHLARPETHLRVGVPSVARRKVLSLRRQDRSGRSRRARCDAICILDTALTGPRS